MYIYIYVYIYIYIYVYEYDIPKLPRRGSRPKRRLRENTAITHTQTTIIIMPSPPTKSLDFRGFDSSRLLILRGGNSHVRSI